MGNRVGNKGLSFRLNIEKYSLAEDLSIGFTKK